MRLADVKEAALACGFDACGVARADALTDMEYALKEWIAMGWHAGMDYMVRNADKRMDVRLLVEGAQSVVCVAKAYASVLPEGATNHVARYAFHDDYHKTLRDGLYNMAKLLGVKGKVCVDTVPISDRHWAQRAGLGWIGKHTLLVTQRWGSWVNLGELVLTEECDEYDTPLPNGCTNCNCCVEACPNGAISKQGKPMIDARRCVAYNSVENRADEWNEGVETNGYIYGCDCCQEACPFNANGVADRLPIKASRLHEMQMLEQATEEQFRTMTQDKPMNRITYNMWQRNLRHTQTNNKQNNEKNQS